MPRPVPTGEAGHVVHHHPSHSRGTFLPKVLLDAFLARLYGRSSEGASMWGGPGGGGDGLMNNVGDDLDGLSDAEGALGFGELSVLYLLMFMAFVGFAVLKRDAVAGTSRRIKDRVRDINEKLGQFDERSGQSMSFYG